MLLNFGDLVVLKDGRIGEVRYIGSLPRKQGKWVGIFLTDGYVFPSVSPSSPTSCQTNTEPHSLPFSFLKKTTKTKFFFSFF